MLLSVAKTHVPVDERLLITPLLPVLLSAHGQLFVAPHALHRFVLHPGVHVPFGMEEDLLLALRVVEAPLVEPFAPERRVRLDADQLVVVLVLAVRAVAEVRRHLVGVVDAPENDRLVRVSVEEIDDHLLADPWPEGGAPAAPRDGLPDPNPARAVGVVFPLAVPVKLHLDTAVLVREYFLAGRPDDDSSLGTIDRGDRREERRAEGQIEREAREVVLIGEIASAGAQVGGLGSGVLDLVDDPRAVSLEMALERELVARDDLAAVARGVHEDAGGRL